MYNRIVDYSKLRANNMSERSSARRRVPALFTALGNIIGNYWKEIAGITGALGGIVTILNSFFGIQLAPYGAVLVRYLTSEGATSILLLVVLISQILLYQRVEWIVGQFEPRADNRPDNSANKTDNEAEEVLTDGGSSDLPPRDDEGRFTTRNTGGSNVFLLVLAAVTGYLFGSETGVIDPVGAALIGVALIAFLQAKDR